MLSFLWEHWRALPLVDIGGGKNTQLLFYRNLCWHNMSDHVFLQVVFFSKQDMELLMRHMSMYYIIWSVTRWLSSWTVIQWFHLIYNYYFLIVSARNLLLTKYYNHKQIGVLSCTDSLCVNTLTFRTRLRLYLATPAVKENHEARRGRQYVIIMAYYLCLCIKTARKK